MTLRRQSIYATSLTLALYLVACDAGNTQPPKPKPTPAPTAVTEQIAQLQKGGKLPKLDRSTDIKGPDTDNNGIRDDIDAWIVALPITDVQKRAAQ